MELKQAILSNPVALFTLLTGEPFSYQIKYLNSKARFRAFRAARQVGKSETESVRAIFHAINKPNAEVLCIAPSLRQSSLLFRKIRQKLRHNIFQGEVTAESLTRIEFKNGSVIICLPGDNPKTIMGFSPTLLIMDEAPFIKEEIYAAILPSLQFTKGDLDLIGTPFGKRGRFYEAFSNDDFDKFHVRAIDCPVNKQSELDKIRATITEMEYLQMYEGEFVESADAFFSRELVISCVDEDLEEETVMEGQVNYYLGVDCARYGLDETVYTIAKIDHNNLIRITFIRATSKKPLTDIIGRIKELNNVFHFKGIYIDSSGLGAGAVDSLISCGLPIKNLKTSDGETKDSVQFTQKNKDEMYKNLKYLMEQGKIKIPKNDKLINQMCDLQYDYSESGLLKLHHPDLPNAHDDFCFCAGTKILTNKGQIPIEKIKVGDLVMTRKGYKKVRVIGNKLAECIEKFGLKGTPNHPFITPNGIEKFINVSDIIYIWNEKQLNIEERNIIDTQIQKEDNYKFIFGIMENGKTHQKHYIDKFMKIIMEKFLRDLLSIIKTKIHLIIHQKILRQKKEEFINQNIKQKNLNKKQEKILKNMQDQKQNYGINQKKEKNGIENTLTNHYRKIGIKRVYNISVDDCNEYFANNILVHNCDSLALAVSEMIKPKLRPYISV